MKGLTGQAPEIPEDPSLIKMKPKEFLKNDPSNFDTKSQIQSIMKDHPEDRMTNNSNERRLVQNFRSGDLQELDEKVKSMMEKSQNLIPSGTKKAHICKVCGKEGEGIAIRDHIEANHLEGISLPCNICGKTFRSRNRLRQHKCLTQI